MAKRQYALIILPALIGGFIGGMASHFLLGPPVFAQKEETPHKLVTAEGFHLVDKKGNKRASLGFLDDQQVEPSLWLFSKYPHGVSLQPNYLRFSDPEIGMSWFRIDSIEFNDFNRYSILTYKDGEFHVSGPNASIILDAKEPSVTLTEQKWLTLDVGSKAVLGAVALRREKTGTTIKRSAASLVLFDKKGKVIWSTPE